jgi:TetR/AcrR family transcriptional repressor of mexJK operon
MRKRSSRTREKILSSARLLFLSQGYTATTVEAIAQVSNLTKRTVYGYFTDKRNLFEGVIKQITGEPWKLHQSTYIVMSREELQLALTELAASLDAITADPDYIKLLRLTITELPNQPDLKLFYEQSVARRALPVVAGVLRSAQAHDLIAPGDALLMARQFVGGFVTHLLLDGLLQPPLAEYPHFTEQEAQSYVRMFIGRVS